MQNAADDEDAEEGETEPGESLSQEDEWPDVDVDRGTAGCMLVIGQCIMMIIGYFSALRFSKGNILGMAEAPQAAINYLLVTTAAGLLLLYVYNRQAKQDPVILYTMPIVFLVMVLLLT